MSLGYYIVGVNHETAPLAIRERLAFTPESLPQGLEDLGARPEHDQAAIMSTCNRAEFICYGSNPQDIIRWLADTRGISDTELQKHVYVHEGLDAVNHLCRVAGGLDSMILGEPQILGQVKQAFADAEQQQTLGSELHRLFQHAFSSAKRIRNETEIGKQPVSVAFAAATTTRRVFEDISAHKALLVGAGETIELVARHLIELGLTQFVIVNRSIERAQAMANQLGGQAAGLDAIEHHLASADIVISSTASSAPVITQAMVKAAFKTRKHRPMLMIDLAVPRDIEADVEKLDDVYLYTVDHLSDIIEQGMESRRAAAAEAELIVSQEVQHFSNRQAGLSAVDTIRDLRSQIDQLADTALLRAHKRLEQGHNPQEVTTELARSLTQKLLHTPTTALRAAAEQDNNELLAAAQTLFNLNSHKQD